MDHDSPLVVEAWTHRVTSVGHEARTWRFDVAGSVTGPDGSGSGGETFVSKSGRVKIEPGSWSPFRTAKVPVGYEITWRILPMFVADYRAPKIEEPTREAATILIQGLPHGKHTLEFVADGPVPIRLIRVYRPPVK